MSNFLKSLTGLSVKATLVAFVLNLTSVVGMCQQKRAPVLKPGGGGSAGNSSSRGNGMVRSVTIPITVKTRKGIAPGELEAADFTVREDGENQNVLSLRAMGEATPLAVAVLIQDNVVSSVGNDIPAIKDFIRRLPAGSRVFVGTIRTGSLLVRQKFTTDLARAAYAVRPPSGFANNAPFNPYVEIVEALKRFESLPAGRRAVLVVSDGLDASRGIDSASPSQSIDLQRAVNEAQRASAAVYSIYAPTEGATINSNSILVNYAQGSLQRLADETGGQAFFQGTGAPVSFDPFLSELTTSLGKQLALTYLSTHTAKGFHRIKILTDRSGIEINHPTGYTR
jgi:VWFA-related protein